MNRDSTAIIGRLVRRLSPCLLWVAAAAFAQASGDFPTRNDAVRWIARDDYVRLAATEPRLPPAPEPCGPSGKGVLRVEQGAAPRCAGPIVILVPRSVEEVRAALQPALTDRGMRLQPTTAQPLAALDDWRPLLMARRPDLRRLFAERDMSPVLDKARLQGSFTEGELRQLAADALARTDVSAFEIDKLPEFKAPTVGYAVKAGQADLQIDDASAFFGQRTAVVRMTLVETDSEIRRNTGGFITLPFPFNLERRERTVQTTPADVLKRVLTALAPLGGESGLRLAESAQEWMPRTDTTSGSPVANARMVWPPLANTHPARFVAYPKEAGASGFAYPGSLLALPDGSVLLGGERWGSGSIGESKLLRFSVAGDDQLKQDTVTSQAGSGMVLKLGYEGEIWWRMQSPSNTQRQISLLRWKPAVGPIDRWAMPDEPSNYRWLLHPTLGPLVPNSEAFTGGRSGKPDTPSALLAIDRSEGSIGDISRPAVLLPNSARYRVVEKIYGPAKTSQVVQLSVRDAQRSWWLDRSIFSVEHSTGQLHSGATPPPIAINCAHQGCLGSSEGNWLALGGVDTLPARPDGSPDTEALTRLLKVLPDWFKSPPWTDAGRSLIARTLGPTPQLKRFERLLLVDLRSGTPLLFLPLPEGRIQGTARTAQGRLLAVATSGPVDSVTLIDMRQPERSLRLPIPAQAKAVERLAFSWDGQTLWGSTRSGLVTWPLAPDQYDPVRGDAAPDQINN